MHANDDTTDSADSTGSNDHGGDGQEQEEDRGANLDRFGGTGLTTSDLTELSPFDAETLSQMNDAEVAHIAEVTAEKHSTNGAKEAYIDAISAATVQTRPDHAWTDPAQLRKDAKDLEKLKKIASLIENSERIPVSDYAEGNVGPESDGTLANHRGRQQQRANESASANAGSSGGGDDLNTNRGSSKDFGLNPSEWRDDESTEGPATTGTLADYRKRQQAVKANSTSDDGAPKSLKAGQRTVYHGEDAYYAEVARLKRDGRWDHPEPDGYYGYRKRMEAKNRDGVSPEDL